MEMNLKSYQRNHFDKHLMVMKMMMMMMNCFVEYPTSKITLTLSLHVPRWVGDNTNLPSNSNILKAVKVNIALS